MYSVQFEDRRSALCSAVQKMFALIEHWIPSEPEEGCRKTAECTYRSLLAFRKTHTATVTVKLLVKHWGSRNEEPCKQFLYTEYQMWWRPFDANRQICQATSSRETCKLSSNMLWLSSFVFSSRCISVKSVRLGNAWLGNALSRILCVFLSWHTLESCTIAVTWNEEPCEERSVGC